MYKNRIFPREDLRERLREETKSVAGFYIFDVRWDVGRTVKGQHAVGRDCLCIFETNRRGSQTVRKELRHPPTEPNATVSFCYVDENGEEQTVTRPLLEDDPGYIEKVIGAPRQITSEDVQECIEAARNRVKKAQAIADRLEAQRVAAEKAKEDHRDEYTSEAATEIMKAMHFEKTGKNPFLDLGKASNNTPDQIVVTDHRRVV